MHAVEDQVLSEFLLADTERWRLEEKVGRAMAFRKQADPIIPETDFVGQPWSMQVTAEEAGGFRPGRWLRRLKARLSRTA